MSRNVMCILNRGFHHIRRYAHDSRVKTCLTRCLWAALRSRFKSVRNLVWFFIKPEAHAFSPSDLAVRILVGGDVSLDPEIRILPYLGAYRLRKQFEREIQLKTSEDVNDLKEETIRPAEFRERRVKLLRQVRRLPRIFLKYFLKYFLSPRYSHPKRLQRFQELLVKNPENQERMFIPPIYDKFVRFNINYASTKSIFSYPFEKIAPFMKKKDLVLVNLETPLTNHPRAYGLFVSDPHYARAMKEAGISVVSLANNHIFDAGEIGFFDTIHHLNHVGISYVGAGTNFEDARLGRLVELSGIKVIFLSYTQWCNMDFASIAAEYPGILPLDPQLMLEDIQIAKENAEYVFVSLHWGVENDPIVHPKQIEIAHSLIDHGADGIIGHHPHVSQGIEVYKKRFILYSLGNFIFAQGETEWCCDNYLAEIIVDQKCIQGIIIYPISGQGQELFQPELITGGRADSLLHELQIKSALFKTGIAIENHVGYITIE